jgi:hypothetical protein
MMMMIVIIDFCDSNSVNFLRLRAYRDFRRRGPKSASTKPRCASYLAAAAKFVLSSSGISVPSICSCR